MFQVSGRAAAALAALLLAPVPSVAQESDWPGRAIQIVVPYTPSTGADILARILGPKLAERWKIAVVVENRAGASGNIGTDFVARATADGYTLLCTATSFGTNPAVNRKLPFDPVKDFVPVIQLARSSVAVTVTAALPAKSMREFLDLARGQPGKLYYSSPGNGGPQHLAMELLKQEARVDLVHVPYKGSGGALADLVGGHVQAMIVSLQTVAPYVQSGKLRMLAGSRYLVRRGRAGRNEPGRRCEAEHGIERAAQAIRDSRRARETGHDTRGRNPRALRRAGAQRIGALVAGGRRRRDQSRLDSETIRKGTDEPG